MKKNSIYQLLLMAITVFAPNEKYTYIFDLK